MKKNMIKEKSVFRKLLAIAAFLPTLLGGPTVLATALAFTALPVMADEEPSYKIIGTVLDDLGDPLIGAAVRDSEGKNICVTDMEGRFILPSEKEEATIIISFMGMKTITMKASVKKLVKVRMEEDAKALKDVVITGYQQLDRRNLTSSVTSVDMKDIEVPGVSNITQMLEGKIPDMVVTSVSGEINATPKLRIRGSSTLIGNREPLWVLDGVILTDPVDLNPDVLNDPDYVNRIGNAIAGINPQDIERIDVLKDAAATALYGTRAANGVIVVTTKSGRSGKPIVSYTFQGTFRRRPYYSDRKINLMNSEQRVLFSQDLVDQHYNYPSDMPIVGYEAALAQLYAGTMSQEAFAAEVGAMQTRNTDWFDILGRNTFSHDHSLNVSGGSEEVRYYTSIGVNDDYDVIRGTTNRRYTGMAKIDFKLGKKFSAQFNVNGYLNSKQYAQDGINPINYAYNTARTIPVYNPDGSLYTYKRKGAYGEYLGFNILNELDNSSMRQDVDNLQATINLRYQINDDLFLNGIFSANVSNSKQESYWGDQTFHVAELRRSELGAPIDPNSEFPYGGEYGLQQYRNVGYTARVQGNYNKWFRLFGSCYSNNINVALGFEASSNHYTGTGLTQRGYYPDRGRTFAVNIPQSYTAYYTWLASNVPTLTDQMNNMLSGYITASYSYLDRFTLNANARYDGSNKFGSRSKEKILPIWSVSGNANIDKIFGWELPWLDQLMLKASYGHQGNMLDNQTPQMIIKKGQMDAYYNEMISTVAYYANPDLRWEKTHSTNVGLETSFFKGRLQVGVEYFYKKTTDAFMEKTIADVNGFDSYVVNSGDITNQGFNITLSATPLKVDNFYWILSGNLSKIYNKVHTSPGAETYELSDFLNGNAIVEGQPVGTFWSYDFAGLSPLDGGPIFNDMEERQSELHNASNYEVYTKVLVPSGKREADLTGSINNTFTWGEWRLGMTWTYSFGAKTRLFRLFDGFGNGNAYSSESNVSCDLLDRWQRPGDEKYTNIPSIMGSGMPNQSYYTYHWSSGYPYVGARLVDDANPSAWTMYDYSTARVVSADYFKLSQLSLTYEFNRKLLSRMNLHRLAVTLSAFNLWTICDSRLRGQTPTQGGFSEIQLSDTPSYTLGVTIDI